MATDATGTPTSLGIPTYNTAIDAPSGLGFNATMAILDTLLIARVLKPSGIATGETAIYNGSTFVRSSVTKLASGNFGPVVNADVDAAAAIAVSKLAPGSNTQVLMTTAGVAGWAAVSLAGKTLLSVREIFQGTTTYTPTTGTTAMFVECIGAGGGGGGCAASGGAGATTGGGGGGGGYSAKWCTTFTAGAITVAVGLAGTAGATGTNAGGAGGDTSFDTAIANVVAKGGTGGAGGVNLTPVLGGFGGAAASESGDIKLSGGDGVAGGSSNSSVPIAGLGGAAAKGGGMTMPSAIASTSVVTGSAGKAFGGGGGGGAGVNSASTAAGGAGANGLIIVWDFA